MQDERCDDARRPRILIVEDDPGLVLGLRINLEYDNYQVLHAEDGHAALELIDRSRPYVVILDLMLPVLDGFGVLKKLRASGNNVPVIVLSGRTAEVDVVAALRCGANDYMRKPFPLMEFMERIKIQVNRSRAASLPLAMPNEIRIGDTVVDVNTRIARRGGFEIQLRRKEFDLLLWLRKTPGSTVSKEQLLIGVWGYKNGEAETRTLDFHVRRLREALEPDARQPRHLITVRGVGYRLVA
ncbi:MAG: response regulator transcription factor [Gemmatimonadota bacterium]